MKAKLIKLCAPDRKKEYCVNKITPLFIMVRSAMGAKMGYRINDVIPTPPTSSHSGTTSCKALYLIMGKSTKSFYGTFRSFEDML